MKFGMDDLKMFMQDNSINDQILAGLKTFLFGTTFQSMKIVPVGKNTLMVVTKIVDKYAVEDKLNDFLFRHGLEVSIRYVIPGIFGIRIKFF